MNDTVKTENAQMELWIGKHVGATHRERTEDGLCSI